MVKCEDTLLLKRIYKKKKKKISLRLKSLYFLYHETLKKIKGKFHKVTTIYTLTIFLIIEVIFELQKLENMT